jgi:hypothetical protein
VADEWIEKSIIEYNFRSTCPKKARPSEKEYLIIKIHLLAEAACYFHRNTSLMQAMKRN